MRLLICGLLLHALGLALSVAFGQMWLVGNVQVCEPNIWVRGIELLMCCCVSAFGLYCMIDAARKIRDKQAIDD